MACLYPGYLESAGEKCVGHFDSGHPAFSAKPWGSQPGRTAGFSTFDKGPPFASDDSVTRSTHFTPKIS